MNRREFLESAAAGVVSSLIGVDTSDADTSTEKSQSCETCRKISKLQQEYLYTTATDQKATTFEHLMRPEVHEWSDDCAYQKFADREDVPYGAEDFQEMDYDINSSFSRGVLSVSVGFNPPPTPLNFVRATVTVGDAESR